MAKYYQCQPIVAGSNMASIPLELRDGKTGLPLSLVGASVTIVLQDETTRELIVENGVAEPSTSNPYWVEYFLTDDQAAKITSVSTWIGQWTITAGDGRKHVVPTLYRIPVMPATL